jgi:hypothetical protein
MWLLDALDGMHAKSMVNRSIEGNGHYIDHEETPVACALSIRTMQLSFINPENTETAAQLARISVPQGPFPAFSIPSLS